MNQNAQAWPQSFVPRNPQRPGNPAFHVHISRIMIINPGPWNPCNSCRRCKLKGLAPQQWCSTCWIKLSCVPPQFKTQMWSGCRRLSQSENFTWWVPFRAGGPGTFKSLTSINAGKFKALHSIAIDIQSEIYRNVRVSGNCSRFRRWLFHNHLMTCLKINKIWKNSLAARP